MNPTFLLAKLQVYYVQDPVETDWHAVITPTIRDYYDMDSLIDEVDN